MAKLRNSVKISASPDKVWAMVGDLAGVDKWVTGITSCKVEGNKRYCEMVNIGGFSEDIGEYSNEKRFYRYTIPQLPIPAKVVQGRLAVEADGKGSRVVWDAEFVPIESAQEAELATMLDGVYKQSLETLRRQLE